MAQRYVCPFIRCLHTRGQGREEDANDEVCVQQRELRWSVARVRNGRVVSLLRTIAQEVRLKRILGHDLLLRVRQSPLELPVTRDLV